ncbi:MAG: hypothetical protein HYZ33_00795, partial [Ignavibacteriales bacterium]|nr:hypothetical protein [Ignavibacteriales bacterium]
MKKQISILLLLSLPLFVLGQSNLPSLRSVDYFRQSLVQGSERERHYSMRTLALGLDFQGMIEDQITD